MIELYFRIGVFLRWIMRGFRKTYKEELYADVGLFLKNRPDLEGWLLGIAFAFSFILLCYFIFV